MSLSVFFLCAGHGMRLRPLTDRIPKPAITFLGESALAINARLAEALKPDRRIANTHHLPDAVRTIAEPLGIEVLHEPELLGTGGAIANAADRLRDADHFLVHNADLIHDIDLAALYRQHLESGALATLAGVHREGAVNTLSADVDGNLLGVRGFRMFDDTPEMRRLTFAGIAFYRRRFLDFVSPGAGDIKAHWIRALESLEAGGTIRVVDCSDSPWFDFGTPQGLWNALKFRMESTGTFAHGYSAADGTRPYVSNEAGATGLPSGLRNVAVYETPKTPLAPGTENRIVGADFEWKLEA